MRVKICGLTQPEHVVAAVEAGVDAIGLVLARSVRQVSVSRAAELLAFVPDSVERFAVFRMPDPDIVQAISALRFSVLQGDAAYTGPLPPGWRFLPTFKNAPGVVERVPHAMSGAHWVDHMVLVDGPGDAGEGVTGDWDTAHAIARKAPLMLAGGLSPDNVASAIRRVQPMAVDVSSGVEASRGHKDPQRFAPFVQAARAALR